ncbi:Uncharacterised protein [Mycobacterium tuberculosis]|uniref:Uncharacterized protein n=1 Tax=Mycobacterium tuberculosis TaxID=1773 RepID=A0A655AYA3_MYCTX|nr:Uncharacterised protein [Mycobacterium tuberculosis]CKW60932.1 Uncharacterised protein [Mycobacterium tuberculosis]
MGAQGVGQRVTSADRHGDRFAADRVEQLSGPPAELLAGAGEVEQRGTGEVHRSGGIEALRIDRWNRTAGGAEQC